MKKIAYITPEMEILELKQSNALLSTGDGTQIPYGGTGAEGEDAEGDAGF